MKLYACLSNTRNKNRMLRGTLGSRTEEVKGEWTKLYNDELHNQSSIVK
jgi:hypothetical protein